VYIPTISIRVLSFPHPQPVFDIFFLIFAILVDQLFFLRILIGISLMTNAVEHLSYSLVICVSVFEVSK
jgi:hypothetical protein